MRAISNHTHQCVTTQQIEKYRSDGCMHLAVLMISLNAGLLINKGTGCDGVQWWLLLI
jgi:hypothetical protein